MEWILLVLPKICSDGLHSFVLKTVKLKASGVEVRKNIIDLNELEVMTINYYWNHLINYLKKIVTEFFIRSLL